VRMASLSVETRARSVYHVDEGQHKGFHLPPIDPPTPVVGARKAFRKPSDDEQQLLNTVKEDAGGLMGAKPHHKKVSRRSRDGMDLPAASGTSAIDRDLSTASGHTDTSRTPRRSTSTEDGDALLVSQSTGALGQ